jgi:hypothetical protein
MNLAIVLSLFQANVFLSFFLSFFGYLSATETSSCSFDNSEKKVKDELRLLINDINYPLTMIYSRIFHDENRFKFIYTDD